MEPRTEQEQVMADRAEHIAVCVAQMVKDNSDLHKTGVPEMPALKRVAGLADITKQERTEAMEALVGHDVNEFLATAAEKKREIAEAVPDPTDGITDAQHKENVIQICMREISGSGKFLDGDGKPPARRLGFKSGLKRALTLSERDAAYNEAKKRLSA